MSYIKIFAIIILSAIALYYLSWVKPLLQLTSEFEVPLRIPTLFLHILNIVLPIVLIIIIILI